MPRHRSRLLALPGLSALALALAPAPACAQVASVFQPTLDATTGGVPRFQRATQPVSSAPVRFGELGDSATTLTPDAGQTESSAGTTGFDSTNARKKKKKKAQAPARPPPLGAADAATARIIAHEPQQLYRRDIVFPDPTLSTATLPTVIVPVHRRPPPDIDPYAPTGVRLGSFLWLPAIDISGGYDSNPLRRTVGPGSTIGIVTPELKVQSLWLRHELKAELRGSYTAYGTTFGPDNVPPLEGATTPVGTSGVPHSLDRPEFDGKINGRLDVIGRSHADAEARFTVGTDNPGSPNISADLSRLPIYTRVGGSLGYTQNFNRLDLTLKGGIDRIAYQPSSLTDGSSTPNDDRDYNQFSVALRGSYELQPGVKPFVEVTADQRVHDLTFDRDGLQRDSQGASARVGTTFELVRRLTGEISAGYMTRQYKDPSLPDLTGLIADASMIWNASALTTVTFTAKSAADESVVADVSGLLRRDVSLQVDHAFRRWLIGTVRAGVGFDSYQSSGPSRQDIRYYVGSALVYKLSRELQLKAEVRRDWLTSNVDNVDYTANTFLIGVRLQR